MEDLKKVRFVQNVTGGILDLPDLTPDQREGARGLTLGPDQIFDLSVYSEEVRLRSRHLRSSLEGHEGNKGFPEQPPKLQVVTGENDPKVVKTMPIGETIDSRSPKVRDRNYFDTALLRKQVSDMESELNSTEDATKRAMLETQIKVAKETIAKEEKEIPSGVSASVVMELANKPASTDL
jgi:hypothetical protein